MSREDEVRRQLEQSATEQQQCPVDGNIDAAFGIMAGVKKLGGKIKSGAKKARRAVFGNSQKDDWEAQKHFSKGDHGDIPLKKK